MGAIEPPSFLTDAVADAMADEGIREYLRDKGRALAAQAVSLHTAASAVTSPPNPWVSKLIAPVATPLAEGFTEEVTNRFVPIAVGGLAVAALVGYLAGRRR